MRKKTKSIQKKQKIRQKSQSKKPNNALRLVKIVSKNGNKNIKAIKKRDAPEILCFIKNAPETLKFYSEIRNSLSKNFSHMNSIQKERSRKRGGYWPFENVSYIGTSASLVLAAEYQRWHDINKSKMSIVNPEKWNVEVYQKLEEVGFFDFFDLPNDRNLPKKNSEDVQIIKMRSGSTADPGAIGEMIDELKNLEALDHEDLEEEFIHLYGAMVEGVMNVVRHAYPENISTKFPHIGKWWITGSASKKNRSINITIYDQGISIPRSLPTWNKYESWKKNIESEIGICPLADSVKFDGLAILKAVETAVSSTSDTHRGLGLSQMRNFINCCKSGFLRIISRNGMATFIPNSPTHFIRKIPTAAAKSYSHSIGGTLIEWNIIF